MPCRLPPDTSRPGRAGPERGGGGHQPWAVVLVGRAG